MTDPWLLRLAIITALLAMAAAMFLGPFVPGWGLIIGLLVQSVIFSVGLWVSEDRRHLRRASLMSGIGALVFFVSTAAVTLPAISEFDENALELLSATDIDEAFAELSFRWFIGALSSIVAFGGLLLTRAK